MSVFSIYYYHQWYLSFFFYFDDFVCSFTYLDSELNGGRPVVILRAKNFVEEHDKQVEITYRFEQKRMIVEPFMLIVFYFSFFVLCSIVARFGGSKKTTKSE